MDNRRILGPEESTAYTLYTNLKSTKYEQRLDGRKFEELRKLYVKTNVVSQAKGSAYMECGNTKVVVSVFDPREIPNRNEYSLKGELFCEFKFAPFSCIKRRSPQLDTQEKEYSVIFRRALESAVCRPEFPNFQVDIYALVLENDGSALSAAITSAGIALAQAGVPMYDLLSCVSVGYLGGTIFVDPTLCEEELCLTTLNQQKCKYSNLKIGGDNTADDGKTHVEAGDKQEFSNLLEIIEGKKNENTEEVVDKMDVDNKSFEHGLITLSMLPTHKQVTEFYQTGSMSLEAIKKITSILVEKNTQIIPIIQSCLLKYVKETLKKEECL